MTNYNEIFNDIYNIKDKINDNEFLELNNKIHKIIKENHFLRKELNYDSDSDIYVDSDYDSDNNTYDDSYNNIYDESDNNIYDNNLNYNQLTNNIVCNCNDDNDGLCYNFLECNNYKKLCNEFPILNNLNEINYKFIDKPNYDDINNKYVAKNITILTKLVINADYNNMINNKSYYKIIIIFITYDYIIRNIKFLMNHKKLCKVIFEKFEEFYNNYEFIIIANAYNININRWYEIIKSINDSFDE